MAKLSDAAQLDVANKLTLGIVSTNTDKNYFEEDFPWIPTVIASDIWADDVPFAATPTEADNIAAGLTTGSPTNPVVDKLALVVMDEVPLSNGQGWALYDTPGDTTSARTIDWLNPQFFGPGYFSQLFENDNTPIALTDGRYQIDSKNGVVRFDEGFTPADLGLLTPLKITIYRYNGRRGIFNNLPSQVQQEMIPEDVGVTVGDTILADTLDFSVDSPGAVVLFHNKILQVQGASRDYTLVGPGFIQILWQPQGGGLGTARPLETGDELIAIYTITIAQ